jgi:hypothetical protein
MKFIRVKHNGTDLVINTQQITHVVTAPDGASWLFLNGRYKDGAQISLGFDPAESATLLAALSAFF